MTKVLLLLLAPFGLPCPAQADVRITVAYSAPADLYSLMDNVSGWLNGFTIPEYRTEWVRRFGWSAEDQQWADRYGAYRRRTFIDDKPDADPLTTADGIFPSRAEALAGTDPLATYFLRQRSVRTAIAGLGGSASEQDARMLRGFYSHFAPKWRLLLAESGPLAAKAAKLQKRFDSAAVSSFVGRVGRFYDSPVEGEFKVFFTRHPPGRRSSAEPLAGSYVLLHAPTAEYGDDAYWDTVVMHELVHFISSRQSDTRKRELTKRFLDRCPMPSGAKRLWLIEEPLAVAWGQAAYSTAVLHKPLDAGESWYAIPWVEVVSRTIAPTIIEASSTESTLDCTIVDQAADRCRDLVAIASKLHGH